MAGLDMRDGSSTSVSVKIPDELAEKVEEYRQENYYLTTSRAIREICREALSEDEPGAAEAQDI